MLPRKAWVKLSVVMALAAPLAVTLPSQAGADDDDVAASSERAFQSPKVLLISLDGAKPDLIQRYLATGVLPAHGGLAALSREGVIALQNVTATPSLTAVAHLAIATGSTAVHNDIPANSFHPVAATINTGISGFAAPIGGYQISPLGPSPRPTAQPLWVRLRNAGKTVVTATWPGGDGADIRINGVVVQGAEPTRVTDYTVPFGAFGGLGAMGFSLTAGDFTPDPAVAAQLMAAGRESFSPVLATAPFEIFTCASAPPSTCTTGTPSLNLTFAMRTAALDTTDDGEVNYDTLVFFDVVNGIQPGPFRRPSTGPAYVRPGRSAKFFFEGTGNRIGTAYFVTRLDPDLSTVRFARYAANFIPRNAPVLEDVDDINTHVGFWAPQPDFRIPERLSPGFTNFPDLELEAIYEDQVKTFVIYQTRVGQRAIVKNPGAELVMVYIEQPDGSGHQFTLTDPRQATDPTDPNSIGPNQDQAKIARYDRYLKYAYQQADSAVKALMETAGPRSNVFVVSDHGMAPFHTAVSMINVLRAAGVDTSQLGIRTSGPAVNIYINLQNRESGGTVDAAGYLDLVEQITTALKQARDPNPVFNYSLAGRRIFPTVVRRPLTCVAGVGFCTSSQIGQDFGDVFAMLAEGYNFDGIQNPGVARLGDPPFDPNASTFSVPNFYGAHGYDSRLGSMSASFLAAGPAIRRRATLSMIHNIDVAPTIMSLLGVTPRKMDGRVLTEVLR